MYDDITKNELNLGNIEDYDAYIRKSRKDVEYNSDESLEKTLKRHEIILQEFAKKLFGEEIPKSNIFKEVVSGDTIADRPEMQKLLERGQSGNRKGVFVVEIERLARGNTIDQGVIAQAFQLTNTKILTPQKIFDLSNEFDASFFEDGLYQARKYLMYTKKILRRGREQSVKEGKFIGSITPFGYRKEKLKGEKGFKLVVDADEAKIVKIIFDMCCENKGCQEIATYLNNIGAKAKKNEIWTPAMIRNILNKPTYKGYVTYGRRKTETKFVNGRLVKIRPLHEEFLLIKGLHEAIIEEEQFEYAQKMLNLRSTKTVPENKVMRNPLSGLVKCSLCGRKMIRRPYYSGRQEMLICPLSGCHNVSSDLKIVEERIICSLKEELSTYKVYLEDYKTREKESADKKKEISAINFEIGKLEKQLDKVCDLFETGVYNFELFNNRKNEINSKKEKKLKQIKKLEEEINIDKITKYQAAIPKLENVLKLYNKSDSAEEKNQLLHSVIEKVLYKKEKSSRWDKTADFELEIYLKI